jgi:hypothetical protein
MIPEVDRIALRESIHFFDDDVRSSEEWANWEQDTGYSYVIQHAGLHYPARLIVALATHTPTSELKENQYFIRYFHERGFQQATIGQGPMPYDPRLVTPLQSPHMNVLGVAWPEPLAGAA